MSFSSGAKAELCRDRCERRDLAVAECCGVLLYCHSFTAREIRIITASPDFAARLPRLFRRAFQLDFDVLPDAAASGKRSLVIRDEKKLSRILTPEQFATWSEGQAPFTGR